MFALVFFIYIAIGRHIFWRKRSRQRQLSFLYVPYNNHWLPT